MEEQLRRIKNKDLSTLDDRLFGNLDKVESISSTIQNLGHFQKFLLTQITQFQQKAKNNKQNKQVTEVIEQNCMTLRQSILRVVPEMQTSRSRLIQSINSPINGFRSTGFQKFKKCEKYENQNLQMKQQQITGKIEQIQEFKRNMHIKLQALNNQVYSLKNQKTKMKVEINDITSSIKRQVLKQFENKLDLLLKQSNTYKEECKQLTKQKLNLVSENQLLSKQLVKLRKQIQLNKQKHIEKLFQTEPLIKIDKQQQNIQFTSSAALKRSNLRENNCNSRSKGIQKYIQKTNTNQNQYKFSIDKIKYDFTSKLSKFYEDNQVISQSQFPNNEATSQQTFRQSMASELGTETGDKMINQHKTYAFRSMQITRVEESEPDHNVPTLLRRKSIGHQYHSSNFSQQTLDSNKQSFALEEMRSNYQSSEKNYEREQSKPCYSTSKKSNHDIMRKTKSNFFKQPVQNKQNAPNPLEQKLYDSNLAKMKGLVTQTDTRKRNSQSKQKLKIFSMI